MTIQHLDIYMAFDMWTIHSKRMKDYIRRMRYASVDNKVSRAQRRRLRTRKQARQTNTFQDYRATAEYMSYEDDRILTMTKHGHFRMKASLRVKQKRRREKQHVCN